MAGTLNWTQAVAPSADFVADDPLGFAFLEAAIGDWLWPGFTRRTTEPGYYVMVAYGLWVAEALARRYGLSTSDDAIRTSFQRWERLWAMSVCVGHDGNLPRAHAMRGAAGVRAAYAGRKGKLPLDYQLISHGRELGALGAYLTSLRDHCLVSKDRLRLTPLGWELARWMWEDGGSQNDAWDELVLTALDPRRTTLPRNVGRLTPSSLGKRASLAALGSRPALLDLLYRRLFADVPPPQELALLPEVTEVVREARAQQVLSPREILDAIRRDKGSLRCSPELRGVAALAVVFADLTASLRVIFDRTYRTVLARGHEAEWSDCVKASITRELVDTLDERVASWRNLSQVSRLQAIPVYGAGFVQIVRRMNTQNPYNIFESVMQLHQLVQRAQGKGGWIERQGDWVFLRHSGYERWALEGGSWEPSFRVDAMMQLLERLRRLS